MNIQDKDVLLSFPQGHLATSMERHLLHMLEGYRTYVAGNQEIRPYSPGSARDESFQEGVRLAEADVAHRAQRTDT